MAVRVATSSLLPAVPVISLAVTSTADEAAANIKGTYGTACGPGAELHAGVSFPIIRSPRTRRALAWRGAPLQAASNGRSARKLLAYDPHLAQNVKLVVL